MSNASTTTLSPATTTVSNNSSGNATEALSSNAFLNGVAKTFRVHNIGLAIFLLVITCIFVVFLVIVIILIVRSCLRRKIIAKRKKKPMKAAYLDDLTGGGQGGANLGTLEYSLEYTVENPTLKVGVVQATDLPPQSGLSTVNPYVGIRLYKDGGGKPTAFGRFNKTTVRHGTSDPTWQQDFSYPMSSDAELRNTRIQFIVFDNDNLNQDRTIGQADVLIRDLDMSDYVGQIFEKKIPIRPAPAEVSGTGEICIGLAYYPFFQRIDVNVYEARHLQISDKGHGKHHVKVKVKLRHKHVTLKREETRDRTEAANPYFNEKLSFTIKDGQLDNLEIRCEVAVRRAGVRTKDSLGEVVIGPNSSLPSAAKQWDDMIKEQKKTHVVWHSLSPEGEE